MKNEIQNDISEIIKEYKVFVEGLDFPVYGRIVKMVTDEYEDFTGELSHYCKQTADAVEVYRPSSLVGSFNRVNRLLLEYLRKFTNIDVAKNNRY